MSARFPEARWRIVRDATHFLENVKPCAEFAFRFFGATANEKLSIGDIVPILLAAVASANKDETMLSSLPSSHHLLESKQVMPFDTVTEN